MQIMQFGFLAWSAINQDHIERYAISMTSEPKW